MAYLNEKIGIEIKNCNKCKDIDILNLQKQLDDVYNKDTPSIVSTKDGFLQVDLNAVVAVSYDKSGEYKVFLTNGLHVFLSNNPNEVDYVDYVSFVENWKKLKNVSNKKTNETHKE